MTLREASSALQPRARDLCRELLPTGTLDGDLWIDGTITVHTGNGGWLDTETNEAGDLIELVASVRMLTVPKAIAWAEEWLAPHTNGAARQLTRARLGLPESNGEFDPLEVGYKTKEETVWRHGTKAFTYRDTAGATIGYAVQFQDGSIRPLRLIDGKPKWTGWKHPNPKPIYNVHLLLERQDAPIIICQTEAEADKLSATFPDSIVLSWFGGPRSLSSCDWTILTDRLSADPTETWPDGSPKNPGAVLRIWHTCDKSTTTYLKARFPTALIVPPIAGTPQAQHDAATDAPPKPPPIQDPFRVLGMLGGELYIHSLTTGDILHFPPTALTELNFQLIAPDSHWIAKGYCSPDGQEADYKAAAKALIAQGMQRGVFNPDIIRGRGCWIDADPDTRKPRVVYHAGDRLYVDGVLTPLHTFHSNHIYIAKTAIPFNPERVLTAAEGQALCDACDMLPWSPSTHGWTLPAFLFLSHLCGVLSIRPHGWLVGGYGSGKSYTCSNVIDPLIGHAAVKALSGSTAPGIRQAVGCDAVAVFGDEFEGKDQQTRDRLRAITELGRQAYVETGWATLHGTASGDGRHYRTRSMFFFSSIAASVLENADLSRFVVLEFQKRDDPDAFERLKQALNATVGQPWFADAFIARAVRMGPLVLQAIDIFRQAVRKACGDSRKADTFGTLAGGRWMLCSDTLPTPAQAQQWADGVQWDNEGAGSANDSDPAKVMQILRMHNHRVQDQDGRYQDMTVDDMLSIWLDKDPANSSLREACYNALMAIGIHPIGDQIDVAVNNQELSSIFKNTPYGDLYPQYLRRPPVNGVTSNFKLKTGKIVRSVRVSIRED